MKAFIEGFNEGLHSKPDDDQGDLCRMFKQLWAIFGPAPRTTPVLA